MTKQEEIRERLTNIIKSALRMYDDDKDIVGFESQIACNIMVHLDDLGVVIKVDRELPDYYSGCMKMVELSISEYHKGNPNISYVAVEPLVEK